MQAIVVALFAVVPHPSCSRIVDTAYDCHLRKLALDYTKDVVLGPWKGSGGRTRARTGTACGEQWHLVWIGGDISEDEGDAVSTLKIKCGMNHARFTSKLKSW